MATPLLWKSYQFQEYMYKYLYRHIVSIDMANEMFQIEKSPKKLFPILLTTVNLLINQFSSVYIVLKFVCIQGIMPIYMLILHTWFAIVITMVNGLNYLSFRFGQELGQDSWTHLFRLDRKLRCIKHNVGYALNVKWKQAVITGIL